MEGAAERAVWYVVILRCHSCRFSPGHEERQARFEIAEVFLTDPENIIRYLARCKDQRLVGRKKTRVPRLKRFWSHSRAKPCEASLCLGLNMDLCSLVSDIDGDVKGLWRLASCYSMRGWVLRSSRTPPHSCNFDSVDSGSSCGFHSAWSFGKLFC